MNDVGSNNAQIGSQVYLQAVGILAAAILLGVIYNDASPLGLRAPTDEEKAVILPPHSSSAPSAPVTNVRTGFVNQTVSMSFESLAPGPAVNPPAATPVASPESAAPVNSAKAFQIAQLKWPEVKSLLAAKQIVLLDARLKANYDIAHIPGAISLPATTPPEQLQALATQYPKDTAFVVYCGSTSCHMSHSLAEMLIKIGGYTNVREMPGGFAEYSAAEAAQPKSATP